MSEGDGTSRDLAQDRSRHCPYCRGGGLVTLYHPKFDGRAVADVDGVDRDGEIKPIRTAMRVMGHCACDLGRWMRSKTDVDTLRRIPDLLDVLAGRSRWLAKDPRGEDPPSRGRVPSPREMARSIGARVGEGR